MFWGLRGITLHVCFHKGSLQLMITELTIIINNHLWFFRIDMKIKYLVTRNTTNKQGQSISSNVTYWKNVAIPSWMEFVHYVLIHNESLSVVFPLFNLFWNHKCFHKIQTEMLAPITKSSAPCLIKYSKVIHVDNIDDINKKLNITNPTASR